MSCHLRLHSHTATSSLTNNQRNRLFGVIRGRRRRGAFRGNVALRHTTIHDEIRAIDKAALIAGKEQHSLGLLNSLSKTTSREMDLTTMSFGRVVTEPVLQERGTEKNRTLETQNQESSGNIKLTSKAQDTKH